MKKIVFLLLVMVLFGGCASVETVKSDVMLGVNHTSITDKDKFQQDLDECVQSVRGHSMALGLMGGSLALDLAGNEIYRTRKCLIERGYKLIPQPAKTKDVVKVDESKNSTPQ